MEITKGEYMIFIELSLNIFSLKDCFFALPVSPCFLGGGHASDGKRKKEAVNLVLVCF